MMNVKKVIAKIREILGLPHKPLYKPSEALKLAVKSHPEIKHIAYKAFYSDEDTGMCQACAIGLCLITTRGLDWVKRHNSDVLYHTFKEDFGIDPAEVYVLNDGVMGFTKGGLMSSRNDDSTGNSEMVIKKLQEEGL
jgi:hypothetical protein